MATLELVLNIGAAVCFLLAAIGTRTGNVNTIALGLFLYMLGLILPVLL